MGRHRTQGADVPCAVCGKVTFHDAGKMQRSLIHYCSIPCYRQVHGSLEVQCEWCGRMLLRERNLVERRNRRVLCSRSCMGAWRSANLTGEQSPGWRGGDVLHYGGTRWKRQRRLARARDRDRCQRCGATEQRHGYRLDVHHLIAFPIDGTPAEREHANRLDNLVTLCRPCHVVVERARDPTPLLALAFATKRDSLTSPLGRATATAMRSAPASSPGMG